MPLKAAPSTPPGKKIQNQLALKGQQRKLSSKTLQSYPGRNYDEELRQYLAATSQEVPAVGSASGDLLNSSLKMPFSKDFGSFDLTICQTDDKKCVVLVKHQRRVFINGAQVHIREDGRICDSHGTYNPFLQKCYDQALKTRRKLRNTSKTTLPSDDADEARNGKCETRRRSTHGVSAEDEEQMNGYDGDAGYDVTASEGIDHGQWGLPVPIHKKSRVSVEAEIHRMEKEFNKIIHALCTLILDVADHETTDTESAHSEGDSQCPDQRQLVQEAIRRFSYQFQSVLELSNNLRDEITGLDDEGEGDDESSDMSSVAANDTCTGSASSVVENYCENIRDIYRTSGGTPAWIHDGKSWRNEKARLNAELAAARSEQQRMQRRQEELHVQIETTEAVREELQELLAEYEKENRKLKMRCADVEMLGFKSADEEFVEQQQKRGYKHLTTVKDKMNSAFIRKAKKTQTKNTNDDQVSCISNTHRSNQSGNFLKTEMKRLRNVADDMEEDMERIVQENVSLRVRVNQMERDRKDLKEKARIAEGLCDEAKSDLACLDQKNAELETRCQNLEREKANNEIEIARTSKILVDLRSRHRALVRDAGEREKTVKMLKTEKQQQRDELDKLERAQIEYNNKAVKLVKDNEELQLTLSQLKRDKANLEAEIRIAQEEREANCVVRQKAEESHKMAMNELSELRRVRAEMSEQISRLQATVASAESCCESLKEQNEELVSRTHELEDQNETLETRTRSLSNTGRLLEVENSELMHMMRKLRSDNGDMKSRVAKLSKSNADFRAKVGQWNRENASADGKMQNLVRMKGDLENIICQMTSLGSDARSQFEMMDTECVSLQEQQLRSKTQLVDHDDDVNSVDGLPSMRLNLRDLDDAEPAEDNCDGRRGVVMNSSPIPH